MTPEGLVKKQILRRLGSRPDIRLFVNFTGRVMYEDAAGNQRAYRAGLTKSGSSDLIGVQSVLVTEEMIGKRLGVFLAIEVKRDETIKPSKVQQNFIDVVRGMGGIAGKAGSVREAEQLLWKND